MPNLGALLLEGCCMPVAYRLTVAWLFISVMFTGTSHPAVWGEELSKLLRRAKIVLNLHYHEAEILETCRIMESLSYGALVGSMKHHRVVYMSDTLPAFEKPSHQEQSELALPPASSHKGGQAIRQ